MSSCCCATRGGREDRALGWGGRLLIGQAPDLLEDSRSLTSAPRTRLYVVYTLQMSRHMPSAGLPPHTMSMHGLSDSLERACHQLLFTNNAHLDLPMMEVAESLGRSVRVKI
jgi:hypothetical protein